MAICELMDDKALEDLLTRLEVRLTAFALCEIGANWRLNLDNSETLVCHFVVEGTGYLETFDGQRIPLARGTIAIVPPRTIKSISGSDPIENEITASDTCSSLTERILVVRAHSDEPQLILGCASIEAICSDTFGLFDGLKEPLVASMGANGLLSASFDALVNELANPNSASIVLTECLVKQVVILLMRHHLSIYPDSPIFQRLGDQRLMRAVDAMIDEPKKAHSINSLAELAGMSRSAFNSHFGEEYGQTPGEFLQTVRMQSGARLLRTTESPIKSIAPSVGFASRSHFSRMFKEAFGKDPSAYREQCRLEEIEQEQPRLAALRKYEILDTPADGSFDRVTAVASKLFSVPIAIVSLVDHDRIWFKSHHGIDVEQIDRDPGLCASAIIEDQPYVVEDAKKDIRALANPLVAGEFGLRFYAAAQLRTRDGFNLGTLCVIDREPRTFPPEQVEQLEHLAAIVMDQMDLRLEARRAIAELAATAQRGMALPA